MISQNTESAEVKRLMEQAQQGNVEAFEQLFQCYRDYMQRMVALRLDPRLRRRIDASDIIQEAHVVATQRIQDYLQREPVSFRVWLRQIVQDQLLMAYRKHVRADRRTVKREIPLPEQSSLELVGLSIIPGQRGKHAHDPGQAGKTERVYHSAVIGKRGLFDQNI